MMFQFITRRKYDHFIFQALIGVAFSLGFIFGPSIGAYFSTLGKTSQSFHIFQYPALFSVISGTIVILLVLFLLKETLPREKRVSVLWL